MKTKAGRSHKKMDPDVKQLAAAARAIERTTPKMREATVRFILGRHFKTVHLVVSEPR